MVVRSLLKYPIGSDEFEDALQVAGPEEIELIGEILKQQIESAVVEKAANERRMAEMREQYPGIDEAA